MIVLLDPINSGDIEMLWFRQNDLISDVDQQRWFDSQSRDPTVRMYIITTGMGDPVGVCGLTSLDLVNQRAEFSLYIAFDHQRQGYGTSAMELLLEHGFNSYPLNQIYGELYEGNCGLAICKKLGMSVDGTRREFYFRDGQFIDSHLVSITRREWLKN